MQDCRHFQIVHYPCSSNFGPLWCIQSCADGNRVYMCETNMKTRCSAETRAKCNENRKSKEIQVPPKCPLVHLGDGESLWGPWFASSEPRRFSRSLPGEPPFPTFIRHEFKDTWLDRINGKAALALIIGCKFGGGAAFPSCLEEAFHKLANNQNFTLSFWTLAMQMLHIDILKLTGKTPLFWFMKMHIHWKVSQKDWTHFWYQGFDRPWTGVDRPPVGGLEHDHPKTSITIARMLQNICEKSSLRNRVEREAWGKPSRELLPRSDHGLGQSTSGGRYSSGTWHIPITHTWYDHSASKLLWMKKQY